MENFLKYIKSNKLYIRFSDEYLTENNSNYSSIYSIESIQDNQNSVTIRIDDLYFDISLNVELSKTQNPNHVFDILPSELIETKKEKASREKINSLYIKSGKIKGYYFGSSDESLSGNETKFMEGNLAIELNKTHYLTCKIKTGNTGFHAGSSILDALALAHGKILYEVILSGDIIRSVQWWGLRPAPVIYFGSERTYVKKIDATKIINKIKTDFRIDNNKSYMEMYDIIIDDIQRYHDGEYFSNIF